MESNVTYSLPEDNSLNFAFGYHEEATDDALSSESFEVISWNTLAGCRSLKKNIAGRVFNCNPEKWEKAFLELSKNKDIILLQEAYPDQKMIDSIEHLGPDYKWNMAISFVEDKKLDIPTGVMTIAKHTAKRVFALRENEPLFPTPKSSLFTEFNLKNDDTNKLLPETLLVVNIHAILMGRNNFRSQLREIRKYVDKHKGPIIMAGDFNTMTGGSTNFLTKEIAKGFERVVYAKDTRVKSIFGYPYDYIFYKGLTSAEPEVVDLSGTGEGRISDHNPLIVRFKLLASPNE